MPNIDPDKKFLTRKKQIILAVIFAVLPVVWFFPPLVVTRTSDLNADTYPNFTVNVRNPITAYEIYDDIQKFQPSEGIISCPDAPGVSLKLRFLISLLTVTVEQGGCGQLTRSNSSETFLTIQQVDTGTKFWADLGKATGKTLE